MSGARSPVSRPVAVTFLLALTGVLVLFGVVVSALLGPLALVPYVGLLATPFVAAVVSARRRRARLAAGRTCTCCTGTVHDPVQVV
jgi:hypothetical protein